MVMDEARLKEIENWFLLADWDTWDPTVNRPTFEQAERYGKDLIAALRDAWREWDLSAKLTLSAKQTMEDVISEEGKRFNDRYQDLQVKQLQERAARAEAERDTLQAMWNTLADAVKDVLDAGDHPIRRVNPLETLVKLEHAVYSEHPDTIAPARKELERLRAVREAAEVMDAAEEDDALGFRSAREKLRRALDAAKEVPR